jgi:hypothetical protein
MEQLVWQKSGDFLIINLANLGFFFKKNLFLMLLGLFFPQNGKTLPQKYHYYVFSCNQAFQPLLGLLHQDILTTNITN